MSSSALSLSASRSTVRVLQSLLMSADSRRVSSAMSANLTARTADARHAVLMVLSAPQGFAKPLSSQTLSASSSVAHQELKCSHTEVTKELTQYIKQHSLQDSENKRRINCDSALKSLLKVSDSDEVTYFNLQRYMKIHFPNSGSNAAATSSA